MSDEPQVSTVSRVRHGAKRETSTTLLQSDECSVRTNPDGGLVCELFRYGTNGKALESYQFVFSEADRKMIRARA